MDPPEAPGTARAPLRPSAPLPPEFSPLPRQFLEDFLLSSSQVSILDRYLIRQTLPPFFLALGIFTFALAIQPMLETAKGLLAKGVSVPTVGVMLTMLLPFALSVTIPMAFLAGVLMMLGRVSADREAVAMLACGVSPWRLLRPLILLGVLAGGLDMAAIMWATPAANQTWREISFGLLRELTSGEIKPRVFFTRFPGKVLYIGNIGTDDRWSRVFIADVTEANRPTVTLAEAGSLHLDRERRLVRIVLDQATRYEPGRTDPRLYTVSRQTEPISISISAESVFGSGRVDPGLREKTFSQLEEDADRLRGEGKPAHAEIMQQQQMLSFPVACVVFALLGLALGLSTRKEGRLAGMTLGLAVVLAYYAVMALAESWVKNVARTGASIETMATWARWIPNIVLGLAGLAALRLHARPPSGDSRIGRLVASIASFRFGNAEPKTRAGLPKDGDSGPRPVVVLRVSRLGLPGPRLLDRYVAKRFLAVISLSFLGLLALYYLGAFLDLSDKLFREPGGPVMFVNFLIQSTPQFIVFIIPIAVLVAVLTTIGGLTRTNELVVMRACGVSLYRVALPLFGFALLCSAMLFVIDERVLGEASRAAAQLNDELRRGRPSPITAIAATNQWLVGDDKRIYAYGGFGLDVRRGGQPAIQSLSAFETLEGPYRLQSHLHAARATLGQSGWVVEHGWEERFTGTDGVRESFERRTLPLLPVADFQRAQVDPSTMTFGEYRQYVRRLGDSGFNVAEQQVNLYRKLAFPFVTVIMTLLAVPFGVTLGRKGALYGIGLAAALAGGYFLLMTVFVAAGSAALLPPMLAAWGANIIFGAGAVYMLLTVRT